jgi:hypothetical protein
MEIKDFEGIKVKITSGDRDWVGNICTIQNVKNDGECEVYSYFGYDFFKSNINCIQINPNEEWNTNGHTMVLI